MSVINCTAGAVAGSIVGFISGSLKVGSICVIAYAILKAANNNPTARPLIMVTLVFGCVDAAIGFFDGAVSGCIIN